MTTQYALARPRTFIGVVLDESTSMASVTETTMEAFNDFLAQQREETQVSKDEVAVTLVKFATRSRLVYSLEPLESVPPLTYRSYRPDGDTALYDGLWKGISAIEGAVGPNARVLLLVITDGEENASREITDVEIIREAVEQREARGNWTFVFLSAGANPFKAGASMGFKPGNVRSYHRDVAGALGRANTALQHFRRGDAMQTQEFWNGEAPKHETPNWVPSAADEEVEDVV